MARTNKPGRAKKLTAAPAAAPASLSSPPVEKRSMSPGLAEDAPAMPPQSEPSSQHEAGLHPETSSSLIRDLPCIPCLQAQSESAIKQEFCVDGQSPDACARCSGKQIKCEEPSGYEFRDVAFALRKLQQHDCDDHYMILLFQRLVCGYLREWNTREALLKGFQHGLQTILRVAAEGDGGDKSDKLSDEMACFRNGAEGMARLLADPKYVEAPHLSVCVGVHVASAMIQDDWDSEYHAEGLERGAEAVRTLLARDGQDFRAQLDGFCQGVKGTMGLVTKVGKVGDCRTSAKNEPGLL